jgi:hypothetical protein
MIVSGKDFFRCALATPKRASYCAISTSGSTAINEPPTAIAVDGDGCGSDMAVWFVLVHSALPQAPAYIVLCVCLAQGRLLVVAQAGMHLT